MSELWLAVCFPALGLEIHREGENDAEPTVLTDNNRVVASNASARRAGIEPGVTSAMAYSIAPTLRHFPKDADAERKRLEWLALVGYRYSSRVSLWDDPPRESVRAEAGLVIEAGGSLRLFGRPLDATRTSETHGEINDTLALKTLMRGLAAELKALGHDTRIASARTPLAAIALANAGLHGLPGDDQAALRRVPLACVGLSARDIERLANMGISHLGPLLDLPTAEIGSRFESLVDYLDRLTGRKADPRPFIEPPEQFRSNLHLPESVDDKNVLLFPMHRLATELKAWLAARQLGTEMLTWAFTTLAGRKATLEVRFAAPTMDAASFLTLSRLRLASVELPSEVMSISLVANFLSPLIPTTRDLLTLRDGLAASRAELVDALTARLGDEALRILAANDDHRPECAWAPLAPAKGLGATSAVAVATSPNTRPLWLLDPPQAVAIGDFQLRSGPERIETGWWDGVESRQSRDYFIATAKSGIRCWLYLDRNENDDFWYLHGYFG